MAEKLSKGWSVEVASGWNDAAPLQVKQLQQVIDTHHGKKAVAAFCVRFNNSSSLPSALWLDACKEGHAAVTVVKDTDRGIQAIEKVFNLFTSFLRYLKPRFINEANDYAELIFLNLRPTVGKEEDRPQSWKEKLDPIVALGGDDVLEILPDYAYLALDHADTATAFDFWFNQVAESIHGQAGEWSSCEWAIIAAEKVFGVQGEDAAEVE